MREPSRLGPHALPALAVSVLVLAIPSGALPLVTLSNLGQTHAALLASGVDGLAAGGMPLLAALVGACAMLAPPLLALLLITWWWKTGDSATDPAARRLQHLLDFVAYWSMPEVYVLGVLIAFVKLGELADVVVRPGLWCFGAMAIMLLAAWRIYLVQDRPASRHSQPKDQR